MNLRTEPLLASREQAQQSLNNYARAYQQLYRKNPRDLRMLGQGWVIVNGARIHLSELDFLTRQLISEYDQRLAERRTVVRRLIHWFNKQ